MLTQDMRNALAGKGLANWDPAQSSISPCSHGNIHQACAMWSADLGMSVNDAARVLQGLMHAFTSLMHAFTIASQDPQQGFCALHVHLQSPNSYFMDVKCQGCFNITTVFSHSQTVVTCSSCAAVLATPAGPHRPSACCCALVCSAIMWFRCLHGDRAPAVQHATML